MKKLKLAWQEPKSRLWYVVGLLESDALGKSYSFHYLNICEIKEAGFHPLSSFPTFDKNYVSSELFPFFKNRVLSKGRKDFSDYLRTLGFSGSSIEINPLDILSITGGERQTDNFHIIPEVNPDENGFFNIRFFVHGIRYSPDTALTRIENLKNGEQLKILEDHSNSADKPAFQIQTLDCYVLGWIPRYIKEVLSEHEIRAARLEVIMSNQDVPLSRKLLVEMSGKISDVTIKPL